MPKVEVNQVAEILRRNKADSSLLRAVLEELNLVTRAEAEEEKAPAVKKQYVIVVSDPDGRFPKADFVGWVVQIPDNESPVTVLDRLHRACYEFNVTKKGRLMPVRMLGEALECLPAKFLKEAEAWVKTKVPVLVVRTDNTIPRIDPAKHEIDADEGDEDGEGEE